MPRPLTTAEALAAGWTRGRLAGPSSRRLFPGVHLPATTDLTLPVLVDGARALLPPDALATSVTALRLVGVPAGPLRPLRFITAHPHQVRRPGLFVSRTARLPSGCEGVVPVLDAFLSAAPLVDLVELVAVGDQLVRRGLVTADGLVEATTAWRGRGARAARRAAHLVRPRVESAQETELRLCLVLAGLPEPEPNITVGSAVEPLARVDLVLRRHRLVLEYEGDQHRRDRSQWNRDIARQEALAAEGWALLRVTSEAMTHPRALIGRVLRALRSAGYTGPDPVLSSEWSQLFSSSARRSRLAHAFDLLECAVDGRSPG
ncbi:endonuclease domain-containing protein [Microlunatus capsulatus]|uniref:DUF559 domain-containing protein n=1 Tax=Microlunatus capsulatus TaxID=99117 RepID=A0ABS4Z4E0_9ACTN|nr:DUF559 domain-containing protein [Microlunatus capsulatus]MBP2415572.1 hypothetical protein [Microlunatus capsulatus]